MHWLASGTAADEVRLRNLDVVRGVLARLAPSLGLVCVDGPSVHRNEDGSIVGMVLLAESHASIHIPAAGSDYLADVFSCVDFDTQLAVDLFVAAFGGQLQARVVQR